VGTVGRDFVAQSLFEPMDKLPCRYRSDATIGIVYCGCKGRHQDAYRCSHPEVNQIVTLNAYRIRRQDVRLLDGTTERLKAMSVPACIVCQHRPIETELSPVSHQEPQPNPSPPVRSESHQNALVAICSNCPRIDTKGNPVACSGPESITCPQMLWPDLEAAAKSGNSRRSGGCCG
jgi:hypothetical protein